MAGLPADSHDGQDLVEILEDYPREELFEISAEELTPIALGVLRLSERKQTRLFMRRDRYGRYMSCLVYLPRDRYTTRVRLRAQGILREALHGASVDYSATVGDSALARLYVVVRAERGQSVPRVDAAALERKLAAAVRSWDEDLAVEAIRVLGEERASTLAARLGASIPETYKADVTAADAVDDLPRCSSCASRGRNSRCGWWSTRSGGRWWCTGRARRSRCPTCCPSCSTWGSRSSTSIRTSSPGTRASARSGSTSSACGRRPPPLPAACASSSRTR